MWTVHCQLWRVGNYWIAITITRQSSGSGHYHCHFSQRAWKQLALPQSVRNVSVPLCASQHCGTFQFNLAAGFNEVAQAKGAQHRTGATWKPSINTRCFRATCCSGPIGLRPAPYSMDGVKDTWWDGATSHGLVNMLLQVSVSEAGSFPPCSQGNWLCRMQPSGPPPVPTLRFPVPLLCLVSGSCSFKSRWKAVRMELEGPLHTGWLSQLSFMGHWPMRTWVYLLPIGISHLMETPSFPHNQGTNRSCVLPKSSLCPVLWAVAVHMVIVCPCGWMDSLWSFCEAPGIVSATITVFAPHCLSFVLSLMTCSYDK